MSPSQLRLSMSLALVLLLAPSCTFHSHVTDLSGVDGIRGVPIEYQMTRRWAVHLLFIVPLLGNANSTSVVEAFAGEAAAQGSERMRIVSTSTTVYWYVFPPFSFLIHPVSTSVEGDVELPPKPAA